MGSMASDSELAPIGFLAVECFFERPPGDPFNERTWPFPLIRELVPGSKESQLVIKDQYDDAFYDRFVEAGKRLAERGAIGLMTSCGFLAMAQPRLAERLPIPIATSALIQIPSILAWLPKNQLVGIITYNGEQLGDLHMKQLSVDPTRVKIRGATPGGHLQNLVREKVPGYPKDELTQELVEATEALIKDCSAKGETIGAVVLECTQMPPFGPAIQEKLGVPVYDVYTMGMWFYSGLQRRSPSWWSEKEKKVGL
ncbi:hypothetical protein N0V83_005826 [Neocucurbitaria cava]|uniref:Aspartate/glutamate racemase family protein n=1 Tax=Neocucurbitaria cava TaxID=798079 RepID=A0A9W9CKM9_9PLEO|nr:hypothetical protein N0V83_005826 [Neocucurbitaria cava]